MACICSSTVPTEYFAVTRSWGSQPNGSRLVICSNCNGLISRTETARVLKLRSQEAAAQHAPVPLLPDIESPWQFPSDAAIAELSSQT
jgi:hypothetical protein